jgi:HEAT repeat protein
MGTKAAAVVKPLADRLKTEKEPSVRLAIIATLGYSRSKDAVPALLPLISEANLDVLGITLGSLSMIGADANDAVKPLATRLGTEKEQGVRTEIFRTLANIRTKEAAQALIPFISSTSLETLGMTLNALGSIGPDAKDAVKPLSDRLKSETDPNVRGAIIQTLGGIHSREAIQTLAALLANPASNAETVQSTFTVLAMVGPEAKDAVGEVAKRLADKDIRNVQMAVMTLGYIGPAAKEAEPALKSLAGDTTRPQEIRTLANQAIDAILEKNKKSSSK